MHPNLKNISYSSRLLLHTCPRKYQIYKLSTPIEKDTSIHHNFGSVVGLGIQALLSGETRTSIIWKMFLKWSGDLLSVSEEKIAEKQKKYFWHAIGAIDSFSSLSELFKDYEVARFNDKAAIELSYRIDFGDDFLDRGFVDIVLVHKKTRELMILEIKTTSYKDVLEATYGNSSQGLGYGVVLDAIAQQNDSHSSSYTVLYLVYLSTELEWKPMPFTKNYLQRAQWIQQVLLDIDQIKRYDEISYWPMYGESCVSFNRTCDLYGICNLADKHIIGDLDKVKVKEEKAEDFVFNFHVRDLLEAQLSRS